MQNELKVAVYWGDILYDTVLCRPRSSITVGHKPGCTFFLELDNPSPDYSLELIKVNADSSTELKFDETIDGVVRRGKETISLSAARLNRQALRGDKGLYTLLLSPTDSAEVAIGHVTFLLEATGERTKIPRATVLGLKDAASVALFVLLTSAFAYFMYSHPFMAEPQEKIPERLVTLLPKEIKLPKRIEPKPSGPAEAAVGQRKTADGGAAKGASGKADLIAKKNPKAKPSKIASQKTAPRPTKQPVSDATSLASELRSANLGNVVKGLSSLAANAEGPAPKVGAPAATTQVGTGGFTTEGFKKGGGGKTLGIGRSVGNGQGGFEGTGKLGLSGNTRGATGTGDIGRTPTAVATGGLDREVIDAIVRQRQDRIRLCYERQLNFSPKLSGKIALRFTIGKSGDVLSSDILEDTMKNDSVRKCLLSEVKGWTFPPPQGGALVTVDYPFVFESSARGK